MFWVKYGIGPDGFGVGQGEIVVSDADPVSEWWVDTVGLGIDLSDLVCPFVVDGPYASEEDAQEACWE